MLATKANMLPLKTNKQYLVELMIFNLVRSSYMHYIITEYHNPNGSLFTFFL